jgi:hypothetical protein
MQPRPTAAELLATVAELLDQHVVAALDGPLQHQARVAASLVAIVERELRLAPAADERERAALVGLLDGTDRDRGEDLVALRRRFAEALRLGLADDGAMDRQVWQVLMDGVRADLAVVKPGHDDWSGT